MKGTGFDIVIDKEFSSSYFIAILSAVFALDKNYIFIAHSIEELAVPTNMFRTIKILAIVHKVYGSFCSAIQFSIDGDVKYNVEDVIIKISKYGNVKCLLPDESSRCDIDMILFLPDGTKRNVYVNSEAMDRNEYIIENYK